MMKHFCLFLFLGLIPIYTLVYSQSWGNEQAFRNELIMARNAVANRQNLVTEYERGVADKRKSVDDINVFLSEQNRKIQKIRELIGIKSLAKKLVSDQLSRKIRRLESELQKAVDENKSSETLINIQRRTNAYRKMLKETLSRYGYKEQIKDLRVKLKELNNSIKENNSNLREPLAELNDAVKFLGERRELLVNAEEKLAKLLKEGPEKLKHVSPPYLNYVKVKGGGKTVYEAEWISATIEVDERIKILEKAIAEQKNELIIHRDNLDEMSDQIVAQNKVCDQLMEEYIDALWWQAYQTIYVEIVSSAANIALDWKDMGPYAFLIEAIDVSQQSFRGKLTANYGLPKGAFKQLEFKAVTSKNFGAGLQSKFGPKEYIKGTLQDAIKEMSGGKYMYDMVKERKIGDEYVLKGFRIKSLTGKMKTISDLKNVLRGEHLLKGAKITWSEVKKTFNKINSPKRLLKATKKSIKKTFTKKVGIAKFGVGVAIGIAKDYAKSTAEQERIMNWFTYAEADALREAMLKNFKAVALTRDFDKYMLTIMQEYMYELIAERDRATRKRQINVTIDRKLEAGNTFICELEFTHRDIQVEKVTLGGLHIEVVKQDGAFWKGNLELNDPPPTGELVVVAKDKDSNKALDNPFTIATYNGSDERWQNYEPGPDKHHNLRLGEKKPTRSFVFLIDCSGSMGEQNRMTQAIAAANQMFTSGKFKETDEVALWIFRGGNISNPVSFTQNHESVINFINSLNPSGGTPLASAIVKSGTYLYTSGRGKYKALIVLTDGDQTSGIDQAIRTVREHKQDVELWIQ